MQPFEELAARLLRGGVAYRHVRRYIAELRDHADDAAQAEMACGASAEEARNAALARLGAIDDLAHGMIARRELQAMSARCPRLWGAGMPALVWIALLIASGLAMGGLVSVLRASGLVPAGGSPALAAWQAPAETGIALLTRAAPVLLGGTALILALRQRTAMTWPLAGAAFLAVISATVQATVRFSATPETLSSLNLGVGISPETALRASVMFVLMLTPLLLRDRVRRLAL